MLKRITKTTQIFQQIIPQTNQTMYVTKCLSELKKNPREFKKHREGRNSAVLVIQDEEPTCCFGPCNNNATKLKGFPFPQNMKLTVNYDVTVNNVTTTYHDPVVFIPVLDLPLSHHQYYAVDRSGKHLREASANAKEEDRVPSCFALSHPGLNPALAYPDGVYQKLEIHQPKSSSRRFFATSVDVDIFPERPPPPEFLARKYWTVEYSKSEEFDLKKDAIGLNSKLRYTYPTMLRTDIKVGKWYVPFIFVKEPDDAMSSTYYSVTLYHRWEEVYTCQNVNNENREVVVNVKVEPEVIMLDEQEVEEKRPQITENDLVVWFEVPSKRMGLRDEVVDKMRSVELSYGWQSDPNETVIETSERFSGEGSNWKSYHCYVYMESFVMRRMDESLVVTFEYRHVNKVKTMWHS